MTDAYNQEEANRMKVLAGILGILLGLFGIHKFVLGYTGTGLVMLLVSVLSLGLLAGVMAIIGLIEGIVYLTCSDQRFYDVYIAGEKNWF